jgi:hypothetical protein
LHEITWRILFAGALTDEWGNWLQPLLICTLLTVLYLKSQGSSLAHELLYEGISKDVLNEKLKEKK